MATSWASETDEKVNYTKLCRLLYDGGTLALKTVFDKIVPPASLGATLGSNKSKLLKLKGKVLKKEQWDLLYPSSGAGPRSEDLDITLLFILLRNICGLSRPATGWDGLPPATDTSREANLVRIKLYRNTVTAHCSKAETDNKQFEIYWNEISGVLVALGLKQSDIDTLKSSPLGEKDYNQLMEGWDLSDKEIKDQLESLKSDTSQTVTDTAEIKAETSLIMANTSVIKSSTSKMESDISEIKAAIQPMNVAVKRLAHRDFDSSIERLCTKYHPKTREWLIIEVNSRVHQGGGGATVIQAGAGMGKSVVAAKLCQQYKEQGILGGCHFFTHDNTLSNNPRLMLQSVARQLCDVYPEYSNILCKSLEKNLGKDISELSCTELFTLLFEEPCSKLTPDRHFVIVLDALDECCNILKVELLKTLKKIYTLPPWLRFVLTTRPPPSISSLGNVGMPINIEPTDFRNKNDLQLYLTDRLKEKGYTEFNNQHDNEILELVNMTQGLFLVAYFVADFLNISKIKSISEVVEQFCKGKGITSVFEDYFLRLHEAIKPHIHCEDGFYDMLEAVVAAKYPIEKAMFYSILGLKDEPRRSKKRERDEAINLLHQLFPVENDHVSAFHKTVIDWLTTGDHDFSVKGDGCGVLANKCYDIISNIQVNLTQSLSTDQPPTLSDCDTYALKYVLVYSKESSECDKEKKREIETDPKVLCLQAFAAVQEYLGHEETSKVKGTIGRPYVDEAERQLSDDAKPVYQSLGSFFFINMKNTTKVDSHTHPTYEQILNMSFQAAYLLQLGDNEKTLGYLKSNSIPYIERETCFEINEKTQVKQVVEFNNGFLVVQYVNGATLLRSYQLDGKLMKEQALDKCSTLSISPDKQSVFVDPFGPEDIEMLDVVSLETQSTYQCPNHVMSCHVFGNQTWYILLRCRNNKLYVMDGNTGTVVGDPIAVQQNENVLSVSNQGCILLVKTVEFVCSPDVSHFTGQFRNFTDDDGNVFEHMLWTVGRESNLYVRQELFLVDYKNPYGKMQLNARVPVCKRTYRPELGHRDLSTTHCFSRDGDLLAFHYNQCITVVWTCDGSLYKSVCLVLNTTYIRDVLYLSKQRMIVHGVSIILYRGGSGTEVVLYIPFGEKECDFKVEHMLYLPRDVDVLTAETSGDALISLIMNQRSVSRNEVSGQLEEITKAIDKFKFHV